ncbi:hypothetical protein BUALT_Bualt11G0098600 [Buddleja alternifolia]|uniref:Syntaxin 6/10/61 N-terminal domain-containing protein n=1 Tax=Buddleja alternifolia TaxID=168488 RepID=A0AAV6X087_9LAMI|nr:hypothetical protein BUALT_Bualt11G0098600 [Buddleja alternifolia]
MVNMDIDSLLGTLSNISLAARTWMESIFRLLLHEQTLVQGDHVDNRVLSSIEYHRRDLATTLETAKWQLEDFERAVNVSAIADKSQVKQNVISRHKQFIGAIKEQIIHVEQSMDTSGGNSLRNMNLSEQDRDGLALFLSGEKPVKHIAYQVSEDNNSLRRFLDPAVPSTSKENIDEQNAGKTTSLNLKEIAYLDHNTELEETFPTKLDLEPSSSVQEANYGRYDEEGTWDLEANEANGKNYVQKNKLRNYYGRMNIFGSLGIFLSIYGSRARRSFTKRLKDGEEQRQPPLCGNVHADMQRYLAQMRSACGCSNFQSSCPQLSAQVMQSRSWIMGYIEKCQRSLHRLQVRHHPILFISAMLLTLLILSKSIGVLRCLGTYICRATLYGE